MLTHLATRNRLIMIMAKHIGNRLNLDYYKIIIPITLLLGLGFIMPFLTNYINRHGLEIHDPILNMRLMIIYFSAAFLTILVSIYINNPKKIKDEAKYIINTYNFIDGSYNYVMKVYNNHKPKYNYLFKPKYNIGELDDIVASLILINIYKFYYTNIDSYNYEENPIRCISSESLRQLFKNKEFKEFYSILFFNPKRKDKQSYYDALVVSVLDAVIHELYKKPWFTEYYEENKLNKIIEFIINQWCYVAIQYNINPEYKK